MTIRKRCLSSDQKDSFGVGVNSWWVEQMELISEHVREGSKTLEEGRTVEMPRKATRKHFYRDFLDLRIKCIILTFSTLFETAYL